MSKCSRIRASGLSLVFTALLVAGVTALATAGPQTEYKEFRYHSGLPGNNSGVTADGKVGAVGAVQMCVPVAYTPSKNTYVIDANVGMQKSGLTLAYRGTEANGTLNFGLGFGRPGRGLYFSYMVTAYQWEPVYNVQWQVRPKDDAGPAIAIGGIDLTNQRASSSKRPFVGDARSYYVVATEQFGSEEHPIYATLGLGTGRFKGAFGGLCYRLDEKLALSAEYDSLGVNGCVTYGLKEPTSDSNLVLFFGIADLDKLSYGLTYTKNN